ncbi:MAG: hypothetical protein IKZ21_00505, partial [Clostridia bacterium]|nr:hypothetical protein [Clostridia bacterium]
MIRDADGTQSSGPDRLDPRSYFQESDHFCPVKYAKAEEPQEREKAKGALKGAVVGFVLIFVLILALNILMPNMIDWV